MAYIDQCRTATDVMLRARENAANRRKWFAPPRKPPPTPAPDPDEKIWQAAGNRTAKGPSTLAKLNAMVKQAESLCLPRSTHTLHVLMNAVCEIYNIGKFDMKGESRKVEICEPRHLYFALAHVLTTCSFPHIARTCGGRHHTTVLSACRKFSWLIELIRKDIQDNPGLDVSQIVMRAHEMLQKKGPLDGGISSSPVLD